jgi:uncharacterized membrane protein YeaQ/YmgE (transglycosylase-associated protein family)
MAPTTAPQRQELAMIETIVFALIVGAVIGVIARLVMPGRQPIGMVMTVLLGAAGGLVGSFVATQFGYHNANGGVAWVPFFIGIAAAVVFIAVYEGLTGRGTRTRTGMFR